MKKKLIVWMAISFVLFQSFLIPIGSASWSGNSWEGQSWEGESWHGDSWEGITWEGDDWQSESWEGQFQNPAQESWSGDSWQANPWDQNGWQGNTWSGEGKPGSVNGASPASPISGQPWTLQPGSGFPGIIAPVGPNAGKVGQPNANNQDISTYDIIQYVGMDLVGGQVSLVTEVLEAGDNFSIGSYLRKPNFFTGLAMSGARVRLGDDPPAWFDIADNVYSFTEKGIQANEAWSVIRNSSRVLKTKHALKVFASYESTYSEIGTLRTANFKGIGAFKNAQLTGIGAPATMGTLAKFNVAAAGIGTVFSAINTVKSTGEAIAVVNSDASGSKKTAAIAESGENMGELLMNSGAVVGAFPGAQAAGGTLVLVGAAIWGVSRVTKLVANNWGTIKSGVKKGFKSFIGAFT